VTDRSTITHRCLSAIAAVALTASALLHAPVRSQTSTAQPAAQSPRPPRSLIQRLRQFLGVNPPVAVGGSRSGTSQGVCLLSPWMGGSRRGREATAPLLVQVPTSTPTLLSSGPLSEVQLLRNERIVWRQRSSTIQPIEGPIRWPLEPLQASEQVQLRLRPRGASGGDFAVVTLQAGTTDQLQRHQSLVSTLKANPERWQTALEQQLDSKQGGDPALAVALASDPSAPAALQQALVEAGDCGKN